MQFDAAFDRLLGFEGGYSNHPSDPGAETMWGVTARIARADGYQGDMRLLPRERAKSIYRRLYWDAVQADALPELLRYEVFDAAVNSGPRQAVKWLQQALGIDDDGAMGPLTLSSAAACDPVVTAAHLAGERLDLMTSLPTWGSFGRGWARRVATNLKRLGRERA